MNRRDRRRTAKLSRKLSRKRRPAAEGSANRQACSDRRPLNGVVFPNDLRADIATSVRNVEFSTGAGGLCLFRAVIGLELLRLLGIPADLTLGGMVYRAGPDPHRDVVSFCGPGNLGFFAPGHGIIGHYWIESGSDVIDFSVGDWRGSMIPALSFEPVDELGPIQWAVDPPDFLWLPRVDVDPIPGQYTPEVGRAYYTGWRGPTPAIETSLRELKTALDWELVADHFERCCQYGALRERVWAAQHGHTVIRLDETGNVCGFG
jgi:hypothetical protein